MKLGDLGSARLKDINKVKKEEDELNYRVLKGNEVYMAPELFNDEKPTIYSDVWALGVVMY